MREGQQHMEVGKASFSPYVMPDTSLSGISKPIQAIQQENAELFNAEHKDAILRFFKELGSFCAGITKNENGSNCEQCCMRMYCYTAPADKAMLSYVEKAIKFLNLEDWEKQCKGTSDQTR